MRELTLKQEEKIRNFYEKQKLNDLLYAVLSLFGLACFIAHLELIDVCDTFQGKMYCDLKESMKLRGEPPKDTDAISLEVTPFVNILRFANTLLCIPLIFFVFMHYKYTLDVMKERKQIYHKSKLIYFNILSMSYCLASFISSPIFFNYCIECLGNLVHVPPGVNFIVTLNQLKNTFHTPLDAFVCTFMLLRFLVVFRLFKNYSRWTSYRAYRIW